MKNVYSRHEKEQILTQATQFLQFYNQPHTAHHCTAVSKEAMLLAERFNGNLIQAELAGYLHDISAVIPTNQRIGYCAANHIPILQEEYKAPMILHQKISTVICRDVLGITDEDILSAVGCHTTLKSGASLMDKIVFLADKISWDQEGEPPYLPAVKTALETSLDTAVLVYLEHLWAQREHLLVVHPWFVAARQELLTAMG